MPAREIRRRCDSGGFTLVELIVVIAIVGMVLTIAIPYFGVVSRRARLDSAARGIQMELLRGRIGALRRGTNVGVEISTDSSKASYQAAIVFADINGNGAFDSGEPVISKFPMPSGDANLTYRIDSYGAPSPGTATQTFTFLFTAFGNATSGSSAKALFLADGRGNQIQVGIPSASSGKVAMTKLSGGVYISPPWTWQ